MAKTSTNIYRRGYVFWWRRRCRLYDGISATIAISLNTRCPSTAKRLGHRLSVEVDVMSSSTATAAQLTAALKGILVLQSFDFADRVRDDIAFARQMNAEESASFFGNRVHMGRVFQGLDELAAEFLSVAKYDKHMEIYLEARGFSYAEIQAIAARVDKGYLTEAYRWKSPVAGTPSKGDIIKRLDEQGVALSIDNAQLVCQQLAQGRATLQERNLALYREAQSGALDAVQEKLLPRLPQTYDPADPARPVRPYAAADAIERGEFFAMPVDSNFVIARDFKSAMRAAAENRTVVDEHRDPRRAPAAAPQPVSETIPSTNVPQQPAISEPSACIMPAAPTSSSPAEANASSHLEQISTLEELVDKFLVRKKIAKSKRQSQFRFTAYLLQLVAGTSQLALIDRSHVDRFREFLDFLPRSFGKSRHYRKATYQGIIDANTPIREREKDLPEREKTVGLSAGTVNRHIGDLAALVQFAALKGFDWRPLEPMSSLRVRDTVPDNEKRAAFEIEQIETVFRHPTWTDLDRPVPPSLYFGTIFAAYLFSRRAEIAQAKRGDVDLDRLLFTIRANQDRSVKNTWSERVLPIPEEALRLGFADYVARLPTDPSYDLFPDLRVQAPNTLPADTFGDNFTAVLGEMIPNARELALTLHSFRHTGVTFLESQESVKSSTASYITGHFIATAENPHQRRPGVRTRHYLKKVPPEILRAALAPFPCVTAHVKPRDWKAWRLPNA